MYCSICGSRDWGVIHRCSDAAIRREDAAERASEVEQPEVEPSECDRLDTGLEMLEAIERSIVIGPVLIQN